MDIWNGFVRLLENVLLTFYNFFQSQGLPGAAGLAIILFTIVARLLIFPLTLKSLQSTRKMQELQPQIKELQRKYGKDQQRLTEETMKLYREYKINPAGGCLPMLLQFPIFIGVYQAVIQLAQVPPAEYAAERMSQALGTAGLVVAPVAEALGQNRLAGGFLWLTDLGARDQLYILPVLSVLFQLIVQLMATPRVQDPQQKAMTQSMLFLPIVFGYIGFTFPSGAVLYWVVGSVLSMIQQYFISGWGSLANYLKFLPPDKGLMPPVQPSLATAGDGPAGLTPSRSAVASAGAAYGNETQKLSFWDVLRPLTEQSGGDSEETEDDGADDTTSGASRRPAGQFSNPRRRRTRR
ncbi:MAG TPA: YidC/Oxa1 family membrane protein insertase [Roseiflexaceae bacterium]|nr:YidC/Oxa1 family membrane protein insertase [Roseiflexaceae bacterium]